jgi:threonine dehydrogenase-like Zn-dependent dehydrogenase
VVDQNYVVTIPDSIPLDAAAPLLCAGITTYSPLRHWKIGPGSKVAVVGLGGLGHMAVKQAVAMGAEVTVLSTSDRKKADAERMGERLDGRGCKILGVCEGIHLDAVLVAPVNGRQDVAVGCGHAGGLAVALALDAAQCVARWPAVADPGKLFDKHRKFHGVLLG